MVCMCVYMHHDKNLKMQLVDMLARNTHPGFCFISRYLYLVDIDYLYK